MPGSKSALPNRSKFFPAPAVFSRRNCTVAVLFPLARTVHRRSRPFCVFSIFLFLSQLAPLAPGVRAQGFGLTKKSVKLQRKMPAAVHLPGPGFDVQVNSHDANNADAARMLSDLLTN